jgi:hypothetical protein
MRERFATGGFITYGDKRGSGDGEAFWDLGGCISIYPSLLIAGNGVYGGLISRWGDVFFIPKWGVGAFA